MILYWQDFFSLILDTLNPSLPSFFQVPFPINQSPTESTEPSQAHSGKTVLREISPSSAPSINSRCSQSKGIPHHITCPCQAERTLPTEKAKPWQFYLPGGDSHSQQNLQRIHLSSCAYSEASEKLFHRNFKRLLTTGTSHQVSTFHSRSHKNLRMYKTTVLSSDMNYPPSEITQYFAKIKKI